MKTIATKSSIVFAWMLLTLQIEAQEFRLNESCFFISMANSKSIFVGINEDNLDLRSKVWFISGTGKVYGRAIWGFDRAVFPYQGGMNERGLIFDINTCAYTGWKEDPGKSNLDVSVDLVEYILSNIATVDEVIDLFRKYNIDLSDKMYVFADANGESVIFEWAKGQLQILRKNKGYQICTNNVQSTSGIPNRYPCERWRIADQILNNQYIPSVDLIRRVLSATCAQSYFASTDYSAICDLVNKKIYLYNYHNYEEVAVFDLKNELSKEGSAYSFQELFKVQPYSFLSQENIGMQWGDQKLRKTIDEKGIKDGIAAFQTMKNEKRSYSKFIFQEWVIKSAGLQFMAENKFDEAIEVFKLNVQEYPDSWEVYSDLAEAYLKKNNIPLAVQNYKIALEKNPQKKTIEETLDKLLKQQ